MPIHIVSRLEKQREFFATQATKPLSFRLAQLDALEKVIRTREPEIFAALKSDLGKSAEESYLSEVGFLYEEIRYLRRHLPRWIKPKRVRTPLVLAFGKSQIHYEPLGISLVIAPWNYPFQLVFAPVAGAIAAGNCVVVKPSELSSSTASIVSQIIREAFAPQYIWSLEGGVDVSQALLEQRYDHIFFTGSTQVGKVVMSAAAKHLTPVTLELGGKSPCLVDETSDLDVAAKRIAWGKYFNAGQTCVAPDYLLVPRGKQEELVRKIGENTQNFFGKDPANSVEYPHIISDRHFQRLKAMLGNGRVVMGGQTDEKKKFISPTVLTDPNLTSPLMTEEIFGPLLPIVEYDSFDEALRFVRDREKPLALYYFGKNSRRQEALRETVPFGGGCWNDTLVHLGNPALPFGGVGASGLGAYHGWYSFECFSHRKSILSRATWPDPSLRYPPFAGKMDWLRRFLR